jgi:hypothetical protein
VLELEALRERLRGVAMVAWADELVDEAQVRAPVAPELRERFHAFLRQPRPLDSGADTATEPETVVWTPEELARELAVRLYEVNQELAAAWDAWAELPPGGRRQVVEQARYLAELFPFMERNAG